MAHPANGFLPTPPATWEMGISDRGHGYSSLHVETNALACFPLPPPYRVMMSLRGRSGSWQHGENSKTSEIYLDDLSLANPVDEENYHASTPQRHNKPQGDEGNSQPMKAHVSVVDYVCPAGKRSCRLWPLPVPTR